jgi:hypothetical protein
VTPSNFTSFSQSILFPSKLKLILSFKVFEPMAIAWNLSNDIFNFVEESILYNYADDNTLSYSDTELNKVVDVLEKDSLNLIRWLSLYLRYES